MMWDEDGLKEVNYGGDDKYYKYIKTLFECAMLYYYDKFGRERLNEAICKITEWSYRERLEKYRIRYSTTNNLAMGVAEKNEKNEKNGSIFLLITRSIKTTKIFEMPIFYSGKIDEGRLPPNSTEQKDNFSILRKKEEEKKKLTQVNKLQ